MRECRDAHIHKHVGKQQNRIRKLSKMLVHHRALHEPASGRSEEDVIRVPDPFEGGSTLSRQL
jgi:hypothetical protein